MGYSQILPCEQLQHNPTEHNTSIQKLNHITQKIKPKQGSPQVILQIKTITNLATISTENKTQNEIERSPGSHKIKHDKTHQNK